MTDSKMKTLVIYKSTSGFTKNYAEWIAEELSADIYESRKFSKDKLKNYNTIIFGGGLYAVGINGIKIIKRNIDILKNKKIIVFATGATPYRDGVLEEIKNKNFNTQEQKYVEFFYLRGGYNFNKLSVFYKMIMLLLKLKLKLKKNLTSDEQGMLNAYNTPVDFTRKKNIDELIKFARE